MLNAGGGGEEERRVDPKSKGAKEWCLEWWEPELWRECTVEGCLEWRVEESAHVQETQECSSRMMCEPQLWRERRVEGCLECRVEESAHASKTKR